MKPGEPSREIKFGGARALVRRRPDGLWSVRWRESGRGRGTTTATEERALERAKEIVRELAAGGQDKEVVTSDDVRLVREIKRLAGERSPHVLLDELADALRTLDGRASLRRAVEHLTESGLLAVERVTMTAAVNKFLDRYTNAPNLTLAGLRKELRGFTAVHVNMAVFEMTPSILRAWVERGEASPRFRNNRLATWKNFFNRCREWNFWPRGDKTPAELVGRVKVPRQAAPEIFTVSQARRMLELLWKDAPHLIPTLVLGCWFGLRPMTELRRVRWEMFDWSRDYLELTAGVVGKTSHGRFVPVRANARAILAAWSMNHGAGGLERESGLCCPWHGRAEISRIARAAGIIKEWPQDVMRHSSISYALADGLSYGAVADAHGNSERVIRTNYRRPLRREDGREWFAISV